MLHFDPAAFYRFKREFRTLADVRHPNLVRLYELVVSEENENGSFFTMDLIRGVDFATHVRVHAPHTTTEVSQLGTLPSRSPLSWAPNAGLDDPVLVGIPLPQASLAEYERVRVAFRQLVEGVRALHAAGYLHRDLKPSNVIVGPDGRVVILDLGVAASLAAVTDRGSSEDGEIVGTATYMAPEQALGEPPTPAADWYSVGVMLYQALLGRLPFVGTPMEILSMKAVADPASPSSVVRTSIAITFALIDGKPERARRGLDQALAQWSQSGFHVQHWQALVYGVDIDVYTGDAGRAYDQLAAAMPALKKSFLLHAGYIRAMTFFVGGRLAISSLESRPDRKAARIAEARRMARKLAREHDPWVKSLSHLVQAAADNAAGDRASAIASLRAGIETSEATESAVYAIAARHRLGQLLGGDEGRALVRIASEAAAAHGVQDLDRWLPLYLPGTWTADSIADARRARWDPAGRREARLA